MSESLGYSISIFNIKLLLQIIPAIIFRLQSVRKSRLFLPSASTALPASWSADWGARAARPISSCPPPPCPHTQPPPPPPPSPLTPPFLSWKAHVQLTHYNSTCPHTPHYFPSTFPSLLLFSSPKRAVAPSKQRGASVKRGGTKSYLSPPANTLQLNISLPTP